MFRTNLNASRLLFALVGRRHPTVVDSCRGIIEQLLEDFLPLSGRTLLSKTTGVCQQVVSQLAPLGLTHTMQQSTLPDDHDEQRALHCAAHRVRTEHLSCLTDTINHLLDIEYVVTTHVTASASDLAGFAASNGPACDSCGYRPML